MPLVHGTPAIKPNIKSSVLSEVLRTYDKHSHNVHVRLINLLYNHSEYLGCNININSNK
jgi:hypothetical protein